MDQTKAECIKPYKYLVGQCLAPLMYVFLQTDQYLVCIKARIVSHTSVIAECMKLHEQCSTHLHSILFTLTWSHWKGAVNIIHKAQICVYTCKELRGHHFHTKDR